MGRALKCRETLLLGESLLTQKSEGQSHSIVMASSTTGWKLYSHREAPRYMGRALKYRETLLLGERAFALREARARVIVMASSTTGWSFPSPTT